MKSNNSKQRKYGWKWGFVNGFARVQLNGKYGFINEKGEEVEKN